MLQVTVPPDLPERFNVLILVIQQKIKAWLVPFFQITAL